MGNFSFPYVKQEISHFGTGTGLFAKDCLFEIR